jgi:hypothetical protein
MTMSSRLLRVNCKLLSVRAFWKCHFVYVLYSHLAIYFMTTAPTNILVRAVPRIIICH